MKAIYTTSVEAAGDGRNGHVTSEDGFLDLDLRIPKEMGGPGAASNPEQLFAAGYAACFHSALKMLAGQEHLDASGTMVSATVSIGTLESGGFGLAVELDIDAPNIEGTAAEALVAKAHTVCPYSNATRGNVEVALNVIQRDVDMPVDTESKR